MILQNLIAAITIVLYTSMKFTDSTLGPFMKCLGRDITEYDFFFVTHDTIYIHPKDILDRHSAKLTRKLKECECEDFRYPIKFVSGYYPHSSVASEIRTEPTSISFVKQVQGNPADSIWLNTPIQSNETQSWYSNGKLVLGENLKFTSTIFSNLASSAYVNVVVERLRFVYECISKGMASMGSLNKAGEVSRRRNV